MGQEAADPRATLPVLGERVDALHEHPRLAEESQILPHPLERPAIQSLELGLLVERLEMTDAAAAEDLHDTLRLGGEVEAGARTGWDLARRRCRRLPGEQPGEGDARQTAAGAGEKVAAGDERGWSHGLSCCRQEFIGHRETRWSSGGPSKHLPSPGPGRR